MTDLYVSGLDLSTGQVVQAEEREVQDWKKKGHNRLPAGTSPHDLLGSDENR